MLLVFVCLLVSHYHVMLLVFFCLRISHYHAMLLVLFVYVFHIIM